jgi:ectoine hydroxylase-related dioxygenase (phytanoyl-CoA dioxygenase family)
VWTIACGLSSSGFTSAVPVPHDQPTLEAGSVILYNPKTMHAGGANLSPIQNKVVLDVMFKALPTTVTGDDTPTRFAAMGRGGDSLESYRDAWGAIWSGWKQRRQQAAKAQAQAQAKADDDTSPNGANAAGPNKVGRTDEL